jgi:hypothetical protein
MSKNTSTKKLQASDADAPQILVPSSIPSPDEVSENLFGRPASQVDEVVWLTDFARLRGITSFGKLAKEIGVSETTVSLVLRGKYGAGLAGFAATVAHFRELWTERQKIGAEPWVRELSIVRRIYPFLELVRTANQIGIIWGENQSGKTKTLVHYCREKPLSAYAKLPPGGAVVPSMQAIAKGRGGLSTKKRDLRDMLIRRFHSQWLLIVDEFHQTIKGQRLKAETIDRIREIHDDCFCPVVLCGTETVNEMMDEEIHRKFLGQIGNRGVLRLKIPTAPEPEDILLLARAYGITSEPDKKSLEIANQIGRENGISKLTDYFKIARQLAANAHAPIAWHHFRTTHATLDSWSKGEFKDGDKPKQSSAGAQPAQLEGSEE